MVENIVRCKKCNRILTNSISIERGYGDICYKIIQLYKQPEQPEQPNNTIIEELLNRVRKVELDNNFMKHQLKHKTIITKHLDEELDWDIKPEIKQKREEYKIEFTVIIKELKIVFNSNKPVLTKNTRFSDEELGIKPLEIQPQVSKVNYLNLLKPINPIEEPISPPIMIEA